MFLFTRSLGAEQPADNGARVITNVQEFWGLSNDEKMKRQAVRFDVLVYYYDPVWQLIWGDCEGRGSFLPLRGEALPVKPGQLVRIEGVVQPSRGILRSEVTVTVLKENAMPPPLPLAGRLTDAARFDAQWTALEGYVCRQAEVDASHLLYEVLTEGRLVNVRVLVAPTEKVPQLTNNRVRFEGVYIASFDAAQQIQTINIWVPRLSDVKALGELGDDPRFQAPRTPLDRLEGSESGAWVRVEGEVRAYRSGESVTIRDETGQIVISTPQPVRLQVGDKVEGVGRVTGSGLEVTLAEAHLRPLALRSSSQAAAGAGGAPRYNLRLVEQVLELPVGEVARQYEVTLKGVVTWADPHSAFFYLQDSSGAICVWRDEAVRAPAIGDALQVRGVTRLGRFAPEIRAHELFGQGVIAMPEPRSITLQQALTGAEEARLVGLRGYLRRAVDEGDWTRLDLTTVSGEFSAYTARNEGFAALAGAIVQLSGVCAAEANSRRQLTGVRLWVPGLEAVKAIELPPADPFAAPHHTLTGLKQFTGTAAFNHRVTIAGVVVAQVPGRYLVLQEGESGLVVYTRGTDTFPTGASVEAAGLPGFDGSRLVLREATVRRGSLHLEAVPVRLEHPTEVLADADACLVRARATLRHVSWQNDHWRLTLQADGAVFDALLHHADDWTSLRPDTELELTGVYLVEFDEAHRPHSFRLHLRSPADLHVLSQPSWWTAGRALTAAGGFAFCTAFGVSWAVLLRRRVRAQTEQIRLQLE
ncbi:MAG TPA: hypothetical protein VHN79_03615, partial [Lacunisphaera sp.]|nr:hypothetical protein [Lacunisphaera sp.]